MIATEVIWGQRPGENAFEISSRSAIRMREVAVLLAGPALWQFTPLFKALRVGHGGSSLQALRLAISLLLDLLQDFRDKGGVLFYPPRDEFPIEANVCGIARR